MSMNKKKRTVLVVDDDEINLMILTKGVQESGFTPRSFVSGEEAWNFLQHNPGAVDIAVLDKMMPVMSGIELLRHIKADTRLERIPVIVQTGDAGVEQMREGLEAGAHYYLTKPYHPEILNALLQSAANECETRERLHQLASESKEASLLPLLEAGDYRVRDYHDAQKIAAALANVSAYPEFTAMGMMELLTNAIEHGNLEIGYDTKREWLLAGTWQREFARRAETAPFAHRSVRVRLERMMNSFHVFITDEGKGFDWMTYLQAKETQAKLNEPSGRGIAKARVMLDDLRYSDEGRCAECNVFLQASAPAPMQGESPKAARL